MRTPLKGPTEAEVRKASSLKAKVSFSPFLKKEGLDVSPQDIIESINASILRGRRLFWLKEATAVASGAKP